MCDLDMPPKFLQGVSLMSIEQSGPELWLFSVDMPKARMQPGGGGFKLIRGGSFENGRRSSTRHKRV